jgi:hypothetical protein
VTPKLAATRLVRHETRKDEGVRDMTWTNDVNHDQARLIRSEED